ncbi:MAG: hypothetical protein DI598_16330 [Pseudopedobacter saltans]|uniref:Copper-binding protein MbnP-like domain-containing protein n=1 Tax=Pseudopedobacter saltans TaxID=151895 RepID=A0A2W5EN10_9SPHI|nr:MAG: hypothetical protein DI598_16330 [Pseudopedobacter saltans]
MCKSQPITSKSTLNFQFQNEVNVVPFILDDTSHKFYNENGDDYYITLFKYYISNIQLIDMNGNYVDLNKDSYLINARDSNTLHRHIENISLGHYKGIKFLIGVDSSKNSEGVQDGDLDPANGMFWSWNTGYVFLKMEGVSSKSLNKNGRLFFHIGGIRSPYNTLRIFEKMFDRPIEIRKDRNNILTITADVNGLFKGKKKIDFSHIGGTMESGTVAMDIADNYAENLFTISFSSK